MNILITSGATREPVDAVRFITNMSSGTTGAALADAFCEAGHEVFYLHGEGAHLPQITKHMSQFSSFADLDDRLKKLLGSGIFDAVVHLAAVSDYSVAAVIVDGKPRKPGKIKLSSRSEISIRLKRNFKILERLRSYAYGKKLFVAGFKLTCTKSAAKRETAAKNFSAKRCTDLVVHNDFNELKQGRRIFTMYRNGKKTLRCEGMAALAKNIVSAMEA
jgi:phosphopantothenoylcysteine decarboxylase/phosphopantothenate--cysteine ligase